MPLHVILGTMTIGGQANASTGAQMLDEFATASSQDGCGWVRVNKIDTARMYQMPNKLTGTTAIDDVDRSTEAILGRLLRGRPQFQLATKANPWAEWDESLSAHAVRLQLETSLRALGRSSVDLFYLHAPDVTTPIRETLQTVNAMHTEGLLGEFGLSNFAPWEVMEIYYICKEEGWIRPTVYQVRLGATLGR